MSRASQSYRPTRRASTTEEVGSLDGPSLLEMSHETQLGPLEDLHSLFRRAPTLCSTQNTESPISLPAEQKFLLLNVQSSKLSCVPEIKASRGSCMPTARLCYSQKVVKK